MKTILLLFHLLVLGIFFLVCARKEQLSSRSFSAPEEIKFPVSLTPVGTTLIPQKNEVFTLTENTPGILEAPAWWKGNRPPAGQMVILEVDYQDVATLPVRAEVYSGMGSGESYSELHRFGGTSDSTWKAARIPCPAQLTMLHLPDSTIRFRLISEAANLPLRGFRLVKPLSADEARYNAETRGWVRKVQALRAKVAPEYYSLAEMPHLSKEWANKALIPFHRDWMDLVMTISAPQAGETDFPISIRMTMNEFEPIQLGIYANGSDLDGVEIVVDPIFGPDGTEVVKTNLRIAEYSLINSRISGFEVEPFPLRLWPNYKFDVPKGRSHMVRIELSTMEYSAPAGEYSTLVRLKAEGVKEISIPLNLEILPIRLLTMEEAGLKLGGHIRGLVPEYDLAFQHNYNHNLAAIYVLPEVMFEGKSSFRMDFRVLDEWMTSAKRQGYNTIYLFLGGNPYGFPQTMSLERQLAETVFGLDRESWHSLAMEKPDSVHPQLAPLYEQWARGLGQHAKSENWPKLVLTPFDEPNKWSASRPELGSLAFIKPHFIHSTDLLRRGFPEALVAADMYTYKNAIVFLPYLDIYSTNSAHLNSKLPEEIRQAGKVFWEYSTVDITASFNRYTLGFFFGAHGSEGVHLWAYNWGKRFDTLDDPNWQYAWYTPFDVIPTPCLEGIREGMDDRRLIETLKKAASEQNVDITAFLDSLFEETVGKQEELRMFVISTWRHARKGRTFTFEDFRQYEKAAEIMYQWHDRIIDKLLALKNDN